MFRYKKKTKKGFITFSSIVILSTLLSDNSVQATESKEEIQTQVTNEEVVVHEELVTESLVIEALNTESKEIVGQSQHIEKNVRVSQEDTVLYEALTDAEGKFVIEVKPFLANTEIKVEVYEAVDLEIKEEMDTEEIVLEEQVVTISEVEELQEIEEIEESEEIVEKESDDETEEVVIEEEIEETIIESEEALEEPVKETAVEEETTEVKKVEQEPTTPKVAVYSRMAATKKMGTSYHYVRQSDTLKSIAQAYGTTVAKLAEWNGIKNVNVISVGTMLSVDGFNNYDNINKETRKFNTTEEFLSFLVPNATKIAEKNNIYTSIMLAQAIHESAHGKSALAVQGNNLFGIKGAYEGNSVNMLTWEEINGKVVWIVDSFRLYPTFAESMYDNADKIRNGLTWDSAFYSGAWVENTASHMDATEWLTGRYATDSLYASKLNNTISYYNLTQYDTHVKITNPIISQQNISRVATLTGKNFTIFQQPKGAANGNVVGNTNNYLNKRVVINKQKVNNLGTWWHISVDGKNLGYVLSQALTNVEYQITSEKATNYTANVVNNWTINSAPWKTAGAKFIANGSSYYNKGVRVVKEATTDNGTYVLLADKAGKHIGWIEKTGIKAAKEIASTKTVNYAGLVNNSAVIYTAPHGTGKSQPIGNYTKYSGSAVEVTQEQQTVWGEVFLNIKSGGTPIGWISKNNFTRYQVSATKNVNYQAVISEAWSINTQPWGIEGYKPIANYTKYKGSRVDVIQEKTTQRGTFALIKLNGKELGWIDKGALNTYYSILSTKNTAYIAKVTKPWSINSEPWGTSGAREVTSGKQYLGKDVTITQEKVTERSTYARVQVDGKNIGWIDKTGIEELVVSGTKDVNYSANIVEPWSINTKPWGIDGYKTVANGKTYFGKTVQVIKEQTTQRSTYALLKVDGKEIGWIDKDALKTFYTVSKTTNIVYSAKVTKPWSINTQPWGTYDAKLVTSAGAYIGKIVDVSQEKVTSRGTYALITSGGKKLGWIDTTGLETLAVSSTADVNYFATVVQPWSINTQPWGVRGFETVASGATYKGQDVKVVQEKITQRGTFALIQVNGKNIGWIDKGALQQLHVVQSTKDVSYQAQVTKPWSINTAPWGTTGSKLVSSAQPHIGKTVEVIQEKVTERSTYVLIKLNGKELGWIDKTGIDQLRIQFSRDIAYMATVTKPWSINTAPWGTEGAKFVVSAASYLGKDLEVIQEVRTQRGTYAFVKDGAKELGWIDVTGISAHKVLSTKNVSYSATIVQPWSINTQPWGTLQFRLVNNYRTYHGKKVNIIQEKTTKRSTYALIQFDGKIIGWIDKDALK